MLLLLCREFAGQTEESVKFRSQNRGSEIADLTGTGRLRYYDEIYTSMDGAALAPEFHPPKIQNEIAPPRWPCGKSVTFTGAPMKAELFSLLRRETKQ
jgi:hypothetical protein